MTLSQKNMILYKMNIIPKEFDRKNDELFYMIYIQNKLKKNKCNLSDDFLENLKKYIDTSRNNNLITEIAPFLSEGQINFILWDYKDILPEWFKGKSDKLRLKYNILMYERFNNDFTYNFHGKNQSFYTLEETKSDTNEKYILEDSKNVKECNLIDESTNNYKLNNIDNSDTQNKFCILENNINKSKINYINNKSKINNHKLIFEKNINPFDLPPGWQEAFFDRKYVSNIIQEKIKILIEETRIDQEKQFDIKNLNLKKEVINFIMKSASKSFFLKTINLCNQFLQETKLLQENSEESHFIKEINFLNLQEKSTKIYFTQKIISNKNVIKYSESVDYNSKDEIIAFVFDNGVVSGNFESKNEKNTFLPLPGQLKIIIFKKHNKFYQMQNHDLIFQKISRQIFIKYEKDEILLFRKNYSKKKIFFEVIKGNPKIEENFDSVKFKGEKFKLLVEISENNWENVIQK